MNKKIFLLILLLISFLYLFVRLYRLNLLIGFSLDQGVHLLETKSMFDQKKISLVGPVTSKTFMGRNFFTGANYYYVLGIIGLISNWDPLIITRIFIFLELFFYFLFILYLRKKFNIFYSLFVFIFISFSPYLIVHSRFIWNPHLLIPLSILVLLSLDRYFIGKQTKYLFLASFFWGFALACHYSAVLWGIFFIFLVVKYYKFLNFKSYLFIVLGFIIGDLPFIIFEIRHNFYNIKTLLFVFKNSSQSYGMDSQYFVFSLLIFILFSLMYLLNKIRKNYITRLVFVITLIILFLFQVKYIKYYTPIDIISGWNYPDQQKVADLIAKNNCPKNFNIAATIQGDTRFYDLRYLLNIRGCNSMEVDAYPQSQKLFLVAPYNRPPETETVWEVSSFKPFKITKKILINDKVIFFELDKAIK